MAELVYALVLGTSVARLEGSSPSPGTNIRIYLVLDFFYLLCYTIGMNKISNIKLNSVLGSFGILAIFAFGIISLPFQASADQAGVVTPYGATKYGSVPVNNGYNTYTGPATTYVAPANTTTSSTVNTATENTGEVKGASTTKTTTTTVNKNTENESNLSANAVSARSGFLPSGILQWVFFAILILLIVILVRKILGADKKYHSTPLKHA